MGKTLNRVTTNFSKYQFLLMELIKKDVKLRYRRSYLGILWTLLEPLLTMIVLTVVFSELLGRGDRLFPVYVLSGRLLYSFFSGSTKGAMRSIRRNSGMIKKVYVPKYMYPLAAILSNFVTFAISLIVLVVVAGVLRMRPSWYMLSAALPLFFLLILAVGVGLILATLTVFFRDLEYLWEVALMLVMYCSAIFYKVDAIMANDANSKKMMIFDFNPLYAAIRNFRSAIYYGNNVHAGQLAGFHMPSLLYLGAFSIGTLVVGFLLFYWKQDEFILNI